jgi:hypothetical protein
MAYLEQFTVGTGLCPKNIICARKFSVVTGLCPKILFLRKFNVVTGLCPKVRYFYENLVLLLNYALKYVIFTKI